MIPDVEVEMCTRCAHEHVCVSTPDGPVCVACSEGHDCGR